MNETYVGNPGLVLVLEKIEEMKSSNLNSAIVERINDSGILFYLKDKGYQIDNTSKSFTIISW